MRLSDGRSIDVGQSGERVAGTQRGKLTCDCNSLFRHHVNLCSLTLATKDSVHVRLDHSKFRQTTMQLHSNLEIDSYVSCAHLVARFPYKPKVRNQIEIT
jgi:hypothetical protein